jgi:hypothetical protein
MRKLLLAGARFAVDGAFVLAKVFPVGGARTTWVAVVCVVI